MLKSKDKHYKQQIAYFGDEFSKVEKYNLQAWQISHVNRIKKSLLDANFKGKTLIDIGTGQGYVAVEMAKIGLNVIACDLTHEALDNIARFKEQFKLKNIKLIECKAEKIPIKDESVDFIVANAILEHIPNEKEAVVEWKRILKPYGKIYITVPLKFKYLWPIFWPVNYIHDKRIGHLRRYDLQSLRYKFNMEPIRYYYTGHFWKVAGALMSIILKTNKFDDCLEKWDEKLLPNKYGASNIIVVFKK